MNIILPGTYHSWIPLWEAWKKYNTFGYYLFNPYPANVENMVSS